MNRQQIKDLALAHGFKLKVQDANTMDLNPYVYEFAEALIAKANESALFYKEQYEKADRECTKLAMRKAKANEREKDFIAYMHDAQKWFDRHDPNGYLKSSHPKAIKALNKFAIEKKIEALNWFSENYCDDEHSFLADKAIEQLRKEQSND